MSRGIAAADNDTSGLRIFEQREIKAAVAHAEAGFQALHLMSGTLVYMRTDTPACFKGRDVIAHLFDRDHARLMRTGIELGVRFVRVERFGEPGQHIDLCGRPLDRAISKAQLAVAEGAQLGLSLE